MNTLFEVKIKHDKVLDDGATKRITEKYMVEAFTCTEAEALAIQHIGNSSDDLTVSSVKATKVTEVFNANSDYFYAASVGFIIIDEKTAAEKHTTSQILVGGEDFDTALANLKNAMKGTLADWELISLSESPIVEVLLLN